MFFCYPRSNGNWRRSVNHLLARWSQFDGKKVVAIAHDTSTDHPNEVVAAFGDPPIEFHACQNTALQEVQPFAHLLTAVSNEPGITLYAHSKGCTHTENQSSHLWCDAMASACLDYPTLIDCIMRDRSTCGAFRSLQKIGDSPSPWHFAGTWYWLRNAALFSRNWGDFEQKFWGTESYPGRHFAYAESACLFYDDAHTAHLYGIDFWRQNTGPAFRWWRESLARCGQRPLCDDPPNCELFREYTH